MHIASFLQDLAIIMIVAGITTIIFHYLKQPVVLGYILAGVIIGKHTPPYPFIYDENTIRILAELGVIFLMFSLGLEFSIRKLFHVGAAALVAALLEIILMIAVGYVIGQYFNWKPIDSLFLGAMLAISSTTIIIKALSELGMRHENFSQLIFGILIIEDILAIGILVILASIAISGSLDFSDLFFTMSKLFIFLVSSLVIGILIVPRFLTFVARFKSKEVLLISVLGVCFGFSLLVTKLGYSVALGAFLIGAITAESVTLKSIEKLVKPLTSMFSAIFFVSIGLLVDPRAIQVYIIPILIITLVLIVGKFISCSLGVFLAGNDGKTSVRVGMGLVQIGEFSFIIASLGISLKVMSSYLYPIIVAVSIITTFLTPYFIKIADPFASFMGRIIPGPVKRRLNAYTAWIKRVQISHEPSIIDHALRRSLMQIFINATLIIAIFMVGSYVPVTIKFFHNQMLQNSIIWTCCLIIALPFLIAISRKLTRLSLIIKENIIPLKKYSSYNVRILHALVEIIPITGMMGLIFVIIALSDNILPPLGILIFILIIVSLLAVFLWPWLIKLHSLLQMAFIKTFNKKNK